MWFIQRLCGTEISYSCQLRVYILARSTARTRPNGCWFRLNTAIDSFRKVSFVLLSPIWNSGPSQRCCMSRELLSRCHLSDLSTMMRFESGSHDQIANVLTTRPQDTVTTNNKLKLLYNTLAVNSFICFFVH